MKVPSWWNRQNDDYRPNTVDPGANRVVRTRTDMLFERKRQSLPFYTIENTAVSNLNLQDYDFNNNEEMNSRYVSQRPAGHHAASRDARDRATIISDYNTLTVMQNDQNDANTLSINSYFR